MSLKKILFVISPVDFRDEEYIIPEQYFREVAGFEVVTYSTQTGIAKGMFGKEVEVKNSLEPLPNVSDFDALVIAGGMGSPQHLWPSENLKQLILNFEAEQKLIAAICISGVVLANAGILKGKKATVWKCEESLEAYEKGQAQFTDEAVTIDGHIITANGPEASETFAKAIHQTLSKITINV